MAPKLRLNVEDVQVESFEVGEGRNVGTVRGHDMFEMDPFAVATPGAGSCEGSCQTCHGRETCTCPATCVDTCVATCQTCGATCESCAGTCPPCDFYPITTDPIQCPQ